MNDLTREARNQLEQARLLRDGVHATPRPTNLRNARYAKATGGRPPEQLTKLRLSRMPRDSKLRQQLEERDRTPLHERMAAIASLQRHADKLLLDDKLKEYGDMLRTIRELKQLERYQLQ